MKRFVSVLLLAFLLFICGCNEETKAYTVELKANGTTGYHWKYNESESGIVKISSEYKEDSHPEGMVGVGGKQIYRITAQKSGEVTLTFNYLSPGTEEIGSTAIYVFTVDKNLNIKEKSHSGDYFN